MATMFNNIKHDLTFSIFLGLSLYIIGPRSKINQTKVTHAKIMKVETSHPHLMGCAKSSIILVHHACN